MSTRVFGVSEVDFELYINKINDFYENHNVIAMQSHITKVDKENIIFTAIIYYTQDKPEPIKEEAPTEKQINLLKKNNLPIPLTKKQAVVIIKELIEGK